MALSSSEHELLVQTCTNMNVAATTCREVLEMLRSLGNTGVVDIATHNNSQNVHTADVSIMRKKFAGNSQYIGLGADTFGSGWGDNATLEPLELLHTGVGGGGFLRMAMKTQGGNINLAGYVRSECYLTDSSGNRVSYSNYDYSKIKDKVVASLLAIVFDEENKVLTSRIAYIAGRFGVWGDSASIAESPYTSIQFQCSNGLDSQVVSFECDMGGLLPGSHNSKVLGLSGCAWKDIYTVNAVTVTSDRRAKKNIAALGSDAVAFIKALRPVSYVLAEGEGAVECFSADNDATPLESIPAKSGVRTHWGLIAQEVKEALSTAGYEDAALWCLADKDDPDSQQSLRYEELIAPMIKVIQQQQERIEALERKVA